VPTLFRNCLAIALFQALGTCSASVPYEAARASANAFVQYQHPRGEGGEIDEVEREYKDIAYAIHAKQQESTLVTPSR
jgi:hypothetical protein